MTSRISVMLITFHRSGDLRCVDVVQLKLHPFPSAVLDALIPCADFQCQELFW